MQRKQPLAGRLHLDPAVLRVCVLVCWQGHLRGAGANGKPEMLPRIRDAQRWGPSMVHNIARYRQDSKPYEKLRDVGQRARNRHEEI